MKSILIATHNAGKLTEFQSMLAGHLHCKRAPKNWPTPIESGNTYRENAEIKARSLFEQAQSAVLSDDSGLEVAALLGGPGVQSANFGGEEISWAERRGLLLEKIHKATDRSALFRCVLCYFDGKQPLFFEGVVEGEIAVLPFGDGGFGYDPIFYSPELRMTFGEAPDTEKARVSHRARATKTFLDWWSANQP